MTEEDEIDVLGDFNFDNIFSKQETSVSCLDSELLGCHDCTMGSSWILDTPGQTCWLPSPPQNQNAQAKAAAEAIDAIDPWGQTAKDKGTQLFGRNNSRLTQIGVGKNQNQVKNNMKSLSIQSSSVSNTNSPLNLFTEYFDDTQIPASIEEVITAVKTGEPTISSIDKQHKIENRQKKLFKSDRKKIKKSENNIKIRKKLWKSHTDPRISNQLIQTPHLFPGGEVVRIAKDQHIESDEQIDVDIDEDEDLNLLNKTKQNTKNSRENVLNITPKIKQNTIYVERESNEKESTRNHILTSHDIFDRIYEIPPPCEEVVLDPGSITKEEKEINYDFFKGSTAKTFERYLKIRNHIIDRWKYCKPEYLSKTSARAGLKHCGDVNCIGRIHTYLEQIGAINFNCAQAKYTKSVFNINTTNEIKNPNKIVRLEEPRRKNKRIVEKSSIDYFNAGGYTIQHEENGDMKIISPKNIIKPKKLTQEKIRLIKCKNFEEFQAPFLVRLHLDALIVMDFHSHLCHSEVIGLLGGYFDEEENVLHLTKAQPCKSKSTQVHCEMCPVSQSEANIQLQAAGLDVVGWYHSHPTFFPNPSIQDLSTQNDMQHYFHGAPFVSFILSPFSEEENSLASIFRCLIVKEGNKTTNFESGIPYRFNVKITGKSLNLDALFEQLENIYNNESLTTNHVIMQDYFQPNITYYQKCLKSVSENMNNADSITNFIKEKILTNLKRIFTLSR